jgi:hypothetical protein
LDLLPAVDGDLASSSRETAQQVPPMIH